MRHVAVFVTKPPRLAQADAVNDGGMVELIGNDRIVLAQQGFKQAAIGVKAGGIQNHIVHLQEGSQALLQSLVDELGAADEAHAGQAKAPGIIRVARRLDHTAVIGQSRVVVGAQVENILVLGGVNAAHLRGGDDAFLTPGAGLADVLKLL